MTPKQCYAWQRCDGAWCAIGGIAVKYWAESAMVTHDVDSVVALGDVERAVRADAHGILIREASLEDTLKGKIKAWSEFARHQSKRIKHPTDIARLIASHPFWGCLDDTLKREVQRP